MLHGALLRDSRERTVNRPTVRTRLGPEIARAERDRFERADAHRLIVLGARVQAPLSIVGHERREGAIDRVGEPRAGHSLAGAVRALLVWIDPAGRFPWYRDSQSGAGVKYAVSERSGIPSRRHCARSGTRNPARTAGAAIEGTSRLHAERCAGTCTGRGRPRVSESPQHHCHGAGMTTGARAARRTGPIPASDRGVGASGTADTANTGDGWRGKPVLSSRAVAVGEGNGSQRLTNCRCATVHPPSLHRPPGRANLLPVGAAAHPLLPASANDMDTPPR